MCVVSVAWKSHPKWLLVAAGNRDEFHARKAEPLEPWADVPSMIAGRDILSRGTWMGVSSEGRFGVVTNVRNPDGPDPDKVSRGALVTDWLTGSRLPDNPDAYNPFNLLVADQQAVHFLSNRPSAVCRSMGEGIHSLSNSIAGELWPRRERLNSAVDRWLDSGADDPRVLFSFLADSHADRGEEHPMFIRNNQYGTRCSTILAVDNEGAGFISERRFDENGGYAGESTFAFEWSV
jgi:uncharacterized protein with NRDE domain